MKDDQYDRAVAEFLAQQGLDRADLTAEHRKLYQEIDDLRKDRIYRHGGNSEHIMFTYRKELREVEERIERENMALLAKQEKDLDAYLNGDPEKKAEEQSKEARTPVNETEPADEKQAEQTDDFKKLTLELKAQREKYFKQYFEEMADIARNPDMKQEDIDHFIDSNKHYLQIMAIGHYKQLVDHPENPYFKQIEERLQREDAERKAQLELEKQQKIERDQAEIQERFERVRRKYAINKEMTQSEEQGY